MAKKMTRLEREWLRGYACCLATAVRLEGCWGTHEKELRDAAAGIEAFKAAGIAEHDAEVIFDPHWTAKKSAERDKGSK